MKDGNGDVHVVLSPCSELLRPCRPAGVGVERPDTDVACLSTSSDILTLRARSRSPELRLDGPAEDLSEGKSG